MSTKHIRTIADLVRFRASLKVECADCGASRTLAGVEAAAMAGNCDLQRLGARLRCGRCGGRAGRLVILPPVG